MVSFTSFWHTGMVQLRLDQASTGGEASTHVIQKLTLCTADNLEQSQANVLTQEIVDHYFECLKVTLEQNNLITTPRQLFNCDETFLATPFNILLAKRWSLRRMQNMCTHNVVSI